MSFEWTAVTPGIFRPSNGLWHGCCDRINNQEQCNVSSKSRWRPFTRSHQSENWPICMIRNTIQKRVVTHDRSAFESFRIFLINLKLIFVRQVGCSMKFWFPHLAKSTDKLVALYTAAVCNQHLLFYLRHLVLDVIAIENVFANVVFFIRSLAHSIHPCFLRYVKKF